MYEQTQRLLNSIFSCELQGKVITIIAPSGLGKTTFSSMQLPCFYFSKLNSEDKLDDKSKFVVINTDNSLLNERFLQVLKSFKLSYSEIRNHLMIHSINSFYKQDELIKQIFKQSFETKEIDPQMIVIDPFNHSLRVEFAKSKEDYRLHTVGRLSPRLEYQLMLLNNLARKLNTVVVLTLLPKKIYTASVPVKWQNAYFGPLEIGHLSDVVLWFGHGMHDAKGITIHVKKHRVKESEISFNAKITEGGLMLG